MKLPDLSGVILQVVYTSHRLGKKLPWEKSSCQW